MALHVNSFGGGVVSEGSADQRRPDEILIGDSLDIGSRGALVCTTDVTDYVTLMDATGNVPWTAVYGLVSLGAINYAQVVAVGVAITPFATLGYVIAALARSGSPPTVTIGVYLGGTAPTTGFCVTGTGFPGTFPARFLPAAAALINIGLVCFGAREGFAPNTSQGLVVLYTIPPSTTPAISSIVAFDALGTGASGAYAVSSGLPGSKSQQLYFRGIIAYNNFVFGWGYDSADTTFYDGPNRVMFCNAGNPLMWGNDNQAAVGTNRNFTDSDAITLGDAGEIIRAAIKWGGKLWFFTNQQGHYIAGFGRDSFLTDGATPVVRSANVLGPQCLIEGPDRMLYGVGDQGLWRTPDGNTYETVWQKLRDYDQQSRGYWDLIWTDVSRGTTYPGRTNQDLVWMASDYDRKQVLIGIPWCDATSGIGYGTDTVVLKYHTLTGGFTRQVFPGVQYTCAAYLRAQGQTRGVKMFGTATPGQVNIKNYGLQSVAGSSAVMPTALPIASFGPYAPFGPDGQGVMRRLYLTLSWEAASSLPIRFTVQTTIDQQVIDSFGLAIQATAPAGAVPGDYWLDTSDTDLSIGNGTSTPTITARPGFLLRTLAQDGATWRSIAGQGEDGLRSTVQLPLTRLAGARYTATVTTLAAAGRFQLEGLGFLPGPGESGAQ